MDFLNESISYFLPEEGLTTSFKFHFKQSGFFCPLTQCCSGRCHHCWSVSSNSVLSQVSSWGLLSVSLIPPCLSLSLPLSFSCLHIHICTYLYGCTHVQTQSKFFQAKF